MLVNILIVSPTSVHYLVGCYQHFVVTFRLLSLVVFVVVVSLVWKDS